MIETIADDFPETDWKIMLIGASTIVFCTLVAVCDCCLLVLRRTQVLIWRYRTLLFSSSGPAKTVCLPTRLHFAVDALVSSYPGDARVELEGNSALEGLLNGSFDA